MKIQQLLASAAVLFAPLAYATPIDEYANTVIDYSSNYPGWAPSAALGAPDTPLYGDHTTAWAPLPMNGTLEFIAVGFPTPVYADGVTIRETYGNGFVYRIDAFDSSSQLHTVWSGTDPSLPVAPVDFLASFAQTSYLVTGLKIYTNTDHNLYAWEEIDSIQLHGDTVIGNPVGDATSTLGLISLSLAALMTLRRRAGRT